MLKSLFLTAAALLTLEAKLSAQTLESTVFCNMLQEEMKSTNMQPASVKCAATVQVNDTPVEGLKEATIDYDISGNRDTGAYENAELGPVRFDLPFYRLVRFSGQIRCVLNQNSGWECLYNNQDKNDLCVVAGDLRNIRPDATAVVDVNRLYCTAMIHVTYVDADGQSVTLSRDWKNADGPEPGAVNGLIQYKIIERTKILANQYIYKFNM